MPMSMTHTLLSVFMVALAVLPLMLIWRDERRAEGRAAQLVRLRAEVGLREQLARQIRAESGRRAIVVLPGV